MILLYLGMWFWLRETGAGRHVYAVGNNPEATRLVGIPTERVLLGVYVLAGVFYGIASLLSVARTGVGDPKPARPKTSTPSPPSCSAEPACSVAAASSWATGWRCLVGVLHNGLTLMGVSSVYQVLVTGILVILAVTVDQLSRKAAR